MNALAQIAEAGVDARSRGGAATLGRLRDARSAAGTPTSSG